MVGPRPWFRRSPPAGRGPQDDPAGAWGWIGVDPGGHRVPPAPRLGGRASLAPAAGTRILFINQYYWPDHASTAQHLTDLAESMAARGYECHVLCSRSR